MGSWAAETSSRMRSSRIIRFVADVSSSISSRGERKPKASTIDAACDVEPEAFWVENALVSAPVGRWFMKGETSTFVMGRPSAARIFTASGSAATSSRPSPGMCA